MNKLSLRLEDLAVESFDAGGPEKEIGTVRAHGNEADVESGQFCTAQCVTVSECMAGCWTYPTIGSPNCTQWHCGIEEIEEAP